MCKYDALFTNKYHIKKTNNDNTEICTKCNIPLICLQQDAIMICSNCGYQELLLVEQNRPILKQNNKMFFLNFLVLQNHILKNYHQTFYT